MAQTATSELVRMHEGREVPHPGAYELDRSHSAVEFVARHLMISKVRGRFADFDGRFEVGEAPEDSSVEVTVRTASVDTGDQARDDHLRSPDFFDAERFPTITFRSTRVEAHESGRWDVHGELTVRDVTKPVILAVDFDGATRTPWGQDRVEIGRASCRERV